MPGKNRNLGQKVSSGIFNSIEKSGKVVGGVLDKVNSSDFYNTVADKFGINWFFDRIINVDIEKTKKQVEKFKTKYPDATLDEIADRLTTHKAIYTAGVGFASGIIPANIPAIVIDFVTTIGAQCELIYELALLYGMDLEDDTRKGEVLTLIALGAGSTKTAESALKLAVDISKQKIGHIMAEKTIKTLSVVVGERIAKRFFAKMIPVLGGIIGASLNAAMITLTGRGAKAFYKNLTEIGYVYNGELPDYIKNVYNQKDLKIEMKTDLTELVIIKIIIYLLHKGNISEEAIQKNIFQYFDSVKSNPQYEEYVLQEINNPTYNPELVEKLDRNNASILLTKAILCINNTGNLNEFHKKFLTGIAIKYDIPFEAID